MTANLIGKLRRGRAKVEYMKKDKKRVSQNPGYRIVSMENPLSPAAEAFRRLKVSLDFLGADEKLQVMQVCSAVQGEGKTTVLLNLGAIYAEDGKKVLFIDLDLRRPRLHRAFKIENKLGIADYLAGYAKAEEIVKHVSANIDLINCGIKAPYPTSVLGSQQLKNLVEDMRGSYDIILIDCPPVLTVTDACITSRLTDGTIFVVSASTTEKAAAKEAVSVFRQNNIRILGCVMTEVSCGLRGSFYYNNTLKYYNANYGDGGTAGN